MKLNYSCVIFLLVCSVLSAAAQGQIPDTDFQIWNETTFVLPVVKSKDDKGKSFDRLSLLLITSLRLGQNRLAFVDERIGGGLDVVINKNFNFSPSYMYVASQPGRRRKEFEHRVRFELGFTQKFKYFSIKDRNRFEYRIRNSRQDTVRYRNRISLHVPVTREGKEIFAPFVSTEPYYDFTVKRWTRNDFAAGITKKFTDKLSADFFAGWRHNMVGLPRDVFAVGANLKVKLK